MRPKASEKIPLFHRIVRVEVSEPAVALLLGTAEILSEGERCEGGARYLGSTLVTVDLAPLAHRFLDRPDGRTADLLVTLAKSDPVLSAALEWLALAEARRRLGPGLALDEPTVEIRGHAQDLVVRLTLDVDARVRPGAASPSPGFEPAEVEAILAIPRKRLRAWAHTGFLPPSASPRYTFLDLVRLKAAWGLVAAGVPLARVRAALRSLAAQLPEEPDPLAQLRIVALGDTVVVRRGREAFEVETGQHLIDFDVADLRGEVARRRPSQ